MKYCKNCGKQIDDNAVFCEYCGVMQEEKIVENTGGEWWGVLSFFFPIIGLILFLLWKDTKTRTAKISGTCALISIILQIWVL